VDWKKFLWELKKMKLFFRFWIWKNYIRTN
jgi:hypothetical protein